jgi:hypothetical protein
MVAAESDRMVQQLLSEQSELVSHLSRTRSNLASHVVSVHKGVPPSTCHKCLNFAQGIFADEANLRDIQKEIEAAKLGK